ncbi:MULTISPECIES: EFR1 family ferrodoxin [unclassified Clostridium]|uniref:EFR1 family ferrodoxin n=1 Tax=unclassified Clostridium TaxID=2614128 RepID=UPI00052CA252|nr:MULTISPECIES: EFR1 family ferrodoxin [unclassified Clostridium]KGK84207.1 4Fe-4S ferredoxin [Clostridium sp. HMP27]
MIFYFSGTGNSLEAAKKIGSYNDELLISVSKEMNSKSGSFEYTLKDNEVIGFVFPVYAWAPPKMVLQFIEKLKINNYNNNYIFSVATCGENIGNTMKILDNCLNKKGMKLSSGFSLVMPNNYIIMGNIDSKEVESKKLQCADEVLRNISRIVKEKTVGIFQIEKGFLPGILTSVINPLFNKYAMNTKKFNVNNKCTRCGICEKVCNSKTIRVKEKPEWGDTCTQCLACIHLCPVKAIEYGKNTQNKGRYKNPNISISEM